MHLNEIDSESPPAPNIGGEMRLMVNLILKNSSPPAPNIGGAWTYNSRSFPKMISKC